MSISVTKLLNSHLHELPILLFSLTKKILYPHLVYHTLLLSAPEVFMCILSDFFGQLVRYSIVLCSPRRAENPYVTNCSD